MYEAYEVEERTYIPEDCFDAIVNSGMVPPVGNNQSMADESNTSDQKRMRELLLLLVVEDTITSNPDMYYTSIGHLQQSVETIWILYPELIEITKNLEARKKIVIDAQGGIQSLKNKTIYV